MLWLVFSFSQWNAGLNSIIQGLLEISTHIKEYMVSTVSFLDYKIYSPVHKYGQKAIKWKL